MNLEFFFQPFRAPQTQILARYIMVSPLYNALQGTNISPFEGTFESMIFLFPRWDMLVSWRVLFSSLLKQLFEDIDLLFTVNTSADQAKRYQTFAGGMDLTISVPNDPVLEDHPRTG